MPLDKYIRSSVFTTSRPTIADLERETRSCYVNQGSTINPELSGGYCHKLGLAGAMTVGQKARETPLDSTQVVSFYLLTGN